MTCPSAAASLELDIRGPEADRVRSAIEQEMAQLATPAAGRLRVQRESDDEVTLVFEAADGRRLERTIPLHPEPEASAREIALLAVNLVRDDVSNLLAANDAPPPSDTAASETASETASDPPLPDADAATAHACGDPGERVLALAVDLVPHVGSSSHGPWRDATRVMSLNLLGGTSGGLRGFELGGLFNVQRRFACGAQIAGAVNVVTGTTRGAQLAGVANVVTGDLHGFQLAGAANVVTGNLYGVQLTGGVNVATGAVRGGQLAGALNFVEGSFGGVQVAGAANFVEGDVDGIQLAPVNIASGRVRGMQLGIVNIAEQSELSLGVVNINTQGRTHLDVWTTAELGILAAGVKHGGKHWHSIYAIGSRLSDHRLIAILGLGGHAPLTTRFYLDVDALGYGVHRFEGGASDAYLLQTRAVVGFRIVEALALFGGPTYNVLLSRRDAPDWSPGFAQRAGNSADPRVHLWPGLTFGLQVLAD